MAILDEILKNSLLIKAWNESMPPPDFDPVVVTSVNLLMSENELLYLEYIKQLEAENHDLKSKVQIMADALKTDYP
jgi:hypothetical protein